MVMGLDIDSPITELKRILSGIDEYIEYFKDVKSVEKVKKFEALKTEYERSINCLEMELHNYD